MQKGAGNRRKPARMRLLIDGHNLIGSNLFSDIHLSDEDDEAKLVVRLKIWQSRAQGKITVIFDRGIPGGIDVKMGGAGVEVIFAANPTEADDLIRRRLRNAKKGLTLVTNDEALLHEAALYGVRGWRGEEFVKRLKPKIVEKPEAGTEEDVQLSKAEVDEWLAIFRAARPASKRPKKRPPADGPNRPTGMGRQSDKNRKSGRGNGKRR
jgi:predicted RNA-binding protein with PIN domain